MSVEIKPHISELEYIIALDFETTGLDEQNDEVLEVAAVFVSIRDGLLVEHRRFQTVLPFTSQIDTWHEKVLEMHTKNGLLAECVAANRRLNGQRDKFRDYHNQVDVSLAAMAAGHPPDSKWTLLGNSVHFDLRFLWRLFPKLATHVSHRVFDVSVIRLFCEALGKPYAKGEPVHRAMPDVQESLRLYNEYREWTICNAVLAAATAVPT